jgi:hypothetical protein
MRRRLLKRRLQVGAIAAGGVAAVATAALGTGAVMWNHGTARVADRIATRAHASDGSTGSTPAVFSRDQLADLPAPVARYFEFALTPGQPLVRQAHFRQAGTFALEPGAWRPFTAVEHFTVHPPALVWDARIQMAPLVSVRVRDSYVDGEGATLAKIAGLISAADLHGGPEMASGALLRYLAEAVWLPTALLPSEGVTWEAINDSTARATLTDGATTAALECRFDEHGEIVSVHAMRDRGVDDTFSLTPWAGHFRDYSRVSGMMIPLTAEVEWQLPDTTYPYWRGRTLSAKYDLAHPTR